MPGYEFEISGKEIVEYICCICLLLIRKALLLPCSHTACQDCLEKWENEHTGRNKCPTCCKSYDKEKIQEGEQGKFIDRVVTTSLNVKCKQCEQGCEWIGTIADYDAHEKTCAYVQFPCRFEDCNNRVARKDMTTHEQNCPYRLVACHFCQLDVTLTKMEEHLNLCEEYQVGCSNNRCGRTMKRKELNHHITEDCPFTIIPCSFIHIGCNVQMARCESEKHFVDFSAFHSSLLLKTTDSLTHQLKQQQLDFQQQEKRHTEEMEKQEKKHTEEMEQQQLYFQQQLQQQEKIHTKEMEILTKHLDKFEWLARFERLQPTKEELSALKKKEKTHNWTFEELFDLIRNNQFDKFNAILLSLNQLSSQQKSNEYSKTLLHLASLHNAPIRTLQLLVERGCKLTDRDNNNELPIYDATLNSNLKTVEWMLQEDIKLINEKGGYGRTPLHRAAWNNNKDIVQLLLSYGADVDLKDVNGEKADELSVNYEIKELIKEYRHW